MTTPEFGPSSAAVASSSSVPPLIGVNVLASGLSSTCVHGRSLGEIGVCAQCQTDSARAREQATANPRMPLTAILARIQERHPHLYTKIEPPDDNEQINIHFGKQIAKQIRSAPLGDNNNGSILCALSSFHLSDMSVAEAPHLTIQGDWLYYFLACGAGQFTASQLNEFTILALGKGELKKKAGVKLAAERMEDNKQPDRPDNLNFGKLGGEARDHFPKAKTAKSVASVAAAAAAAAAGSTASASSAKAPVVHQSPGNFKPGTKKAQRAKLGLTDEEPSPLNEDGTPRISFDYALRQIHKALKRSPEWQQSAVSAVFEKDQLLFGQLGLTMDKLKQYYLYPGQQERWNLLSTLLQEIPHEVHNASTAQPTSL